MSPHAVPMLIPMAVLVIWSLVILAWLATVRVRAMIRLRVHPQKYPRTQDLGAALPENAQWKADNYNNLMEQPTLFYAVVLALAYLGESSGLNLILAWAYVASRVVHSLVHVIANRVVWRFRVFAVSTVILLALAISLLVSLLGA